MSPCRRIPRTLMLLAALWLLLPAQWGGHLGYTVVSGTSMLPHWHTGDLVLTWPADRYRPGDVVVYRVPEGEPGAGGSVIHRVVGRDTAGLVTRGDNRDSVDIWRPTDAEVTGRQIVSVPHLGWLPVYLRHPLVSAAAASVMAAVGVRRRGKPEAS